MTLPAFKKRSMQVRYDILLEQTRREVILTVLALIGGNVFGRSVSLPFNRALHCTQTVITSDLSREFDACGEHEIAELLAALRHVQTSLAQVLAGM
jgi:hypothetical protein